MQLGIVVYDANTVCLAVNSRGQVVENSFPSKVKMKGINDIPLIECSHCFHAVRETLYLA